MLKKYFSYAYFVGYFCFWVCSWFFIGSISLAEDSPYPIKKGSADSKTLYSSFLLLSHDEACALETLQSNLPDGSVVRYFFKNISAFWLYLPSRQLTTDNKGGSSLSSILPSFYQGLCQIKEGLEKKGCFEDIFFLSGDAVRDFNALCAKLQSFTQQNTSPQKPPQGLDFKSSFYQIQAPKIKSARSLGLSPDIPSSKKEKSKKASIFSVPVPSASAPSGACTSDRPFLTNEACYTTELFQLTNIKLGEGVKVGVYDTGYKKGVNSAEVDAMVDSVGFNLPKFSETYPDYISYEELAKVLPLGIVAHGVEPPDQAPAALVDLAHGAHVVRQLVALASKLDRVVVFDFFKDPFALAMAYYMDQGIKLVNISANLFVNDEGAYEKYLALVKTLYSKGLLIIVAIPQYREFDIDTEPVPFKISGGDTSPAYYYLLKAEETLVVGSLDPVYLYPASPTYSSTRKNYVLAPASSDDLNPMFRAATSFAAPVATALAAIRLSNFPQKTVSDLLSDLLGTAVKIYPCSLPQYLSIDSRSYRDQTCVTDPTSQGVLQGREQINLQLRNGVLNAAKLFGLKSRFEESGFDQFVYCNFLYFNKSVVQEITCKDKDTVKSAIEFLYSDLQRQRNLVSNLFSNKFGAKPPLNWPASILTDPFTLLRNRRPDGTYIIFTSQLQQDMYYTALIYTQQVYFNQVASMTSANVCQSITGKNTSDAITYIVNLFSDVRSVLERDLIQLLCSQSH